ncbi:MAG: hypothetical protein DRN81_02205 [Thermoproteota archaeon]|nr:MAG: hypothetical protein DRN81_02205 [Candidatus Korarchaeota archaeon]
MPEYDWEYIRPLAEGGQARIALYRKKGDVAGRLYIGKSALKPELAPYVKREHSILERLIRSGFQYAVDEDCSGPGGYTSYRRYYEGVNLQEFIEGKDGIPNFFREGTDASERFLTFAYRLSNLVYHLHEEMEYVHRDIKPKNVIYGRDGIVALIDLGIAKKIGDSGNSEGTPGWADPQQLLPGQVVTTSHDLYSLAKTFIWSLGLSPEEKSIKQRKPSWMMRNKSAAQLLELCLDCITKVNAGRPSVMDLLSALRRAQAVGDRRKKVYDTCPNPDCGVSTPVKAPFCFSCLTPLLLEQPTGICGLCNKEIPLDRMARHYREYHPDSDAITSGAYHPTAGRGKKIYVCNNCEWTTQDSNLYKIHKSVCQDRDKLLKPPRLDFRPIDRFEQWKEISTNPRALFGFSDSGIRFESLEVYRSLDIKFYEHQEDAVLRALRDLGGRCIIADSVGLGKTIECGIILRELIYRDEVESVLILVPNYELQDQWLEELEEKFELGPGSEFGFRKWRVTDPAPKRGSKVIAEFKHALERRTLPHDKSCKSCDFFGPEKIHWDAIIVDEAHELGLNYKGIRWQQLLKMDPRYLFLVTATPIRNDPVNL